MDLFMFECSSDRNLKLLVPSMQIPEAARQKCTGTWNFAEKSDWEFVKRLLDFGPDDSRVAINSRKATEDVTKDGFHVARIEVRVTTIQSTRLRSPE
jgi:hypothetical protein